MATSVLTPQPVPAMAKSEYKPFQSAPTILEEVKAQQERLRDRLAGALTNPPPGISADSLPTVPLIDIGPSFDGNLSSRKAVAAQIRQACVTTGFFQIANHGVLEQARAGVLEQAARFFSELSEDQKQALHIRNSPLLRGYEPYDATYVNTDDQDGAQKETKEGFNWGYEGGLDPTGGDGKYVELDGSSPQTTGSGNLWPSPKDLPGFYEKIADYYGQVLQLARHLFRLFALSLDLEEDYFDASTTHPGGIARLLYYPGQPALEKESSNSAWEAASKLGLGAHTDYECFTILLSSSNPGLEILFPPSPATGNLPIWRPCPVVPGSFTINVADFFQRWTNGLYKSTIHRVVSKPGTGERYSVPFFFSINYDSDVLPLPERCVGESRFLPLKAGEYVLERLRATQLLEAAT